MYFVEKTKGINFSKQFDYPLLIAVLALTSMGLLVLSSATKVMPNGADGSRIMMVQILTALLGVILALFISAIDYKDFKTLGMILYIISIILLIVVLFKGTGDTLGSRSWLQIPVIGKFQPSEIAKTTTILVVSVFFERIMEGNTDRKNIIKLIIYASVPLALILAEKDFGTALVFIFILFIMVYIAGLPYKYILTGLGVFIASLPFIWFFALNDTRKNRIRVFLNPELDPMRAGFNVLRSKIAVGSGQFFGKGLYQGIQTQNAGVPVKESDFIFSVVGEELGFIGAVILIALILFIILRCVYVAKNSRDLYGSFLVIGVASMLAFHFIENVGMCIGLVPVTGIPLPFVSQGGSSMVTNYISIGIVLSVSMRRKRTIFNSTE